MVFEFEFEEWPHTIERLQTAVKRSKSKILSNLEGITNRVSEAASGMVERIEKHLSSCDFWREDTKETPNGQFEQSRVIPSVDPGT